MIQDLLVRSHSHACAFFSNSLILTANFPPILLNPLQLRRCNIELDFRDDSYQFPIECCGKQRCEGCNKHLDAISAESCDFCNATFESTWSLTAKRLQKHSKRGRPWAQAYLARLYSEGGYGVKESPCVALHWYRLAGRQGHPHGCMFSGMAYLEGTSGSPVDLVLARKDFDTALRTTIDEDCTMVCRDALVQVALQHFHENSIETAKSILFPLLVDSSNARAVLASIHILEGDRALALPLFVSTALDTTSPADNRPIYAFGALQCCLELGKFVQAKAWGRIARKMGLGLDSSRFQRVQLLVQLQRRLRSLRDTCGGCGVEFQGKARKFCRGCRAYCYCSRECQKMHWNRKKDDHREDCKGLVELKEKVREMKKGSSSEGN